MGRRLRHSADQLLLWSVDSPARTSASPGAARASAETDRDCGGRCCGSCERCDPVGWSLRTYLLSALAEQTTYSLAWKQRATPSGRPWWVLGRSAPRTDETGCGLWPTPDVGMTRGSQKPRSGNPHDMGGLAHVVSTQDWPTPAARDWRDDGHCPGAQERKSPCLPASVQLAGPPDPASPSTSGKRRGSLNPAWVAQLMGLPADWLDVPDDDAATN